MIKLYNQNIWGSYRKGEAVSNRSGLILGLIGENAPDIITFQECNPATFRAEEPSIIKLLSEGYIEAAGDHAGENFTPVLYRRDRFRLIEEGFHPYSGLNDIGSKSLSYAVLDDTESGKRITFASTHFWFKATGEVDEEQRRENAREAAAICRDIAAKHGCAVILAGDLNSSAKNGQGLGGYLEILEQGFSDVRHTAAVTTDSETIHDYPPKGEDGNYLPGEMPSDTLDYVLTMGDARAARFSVLTDERSLASSDHCPLIAEFDI